MKEEVPEKYALTDLERRLMHAIQWLLIHDGYGSAPAKQRDKRVKKLLKRKGTVKGDR